MYNEKVCGILFSNTHDDIITDLTEKRTLGSVPFGGRYRLIDFPLSNMVRSGVSQVGVITKYNYQSLIDHLGSGREWDLTRKVGGLHILPPFGNTTHDGIYRGKMEALRGALDFLTHSKCKYVLMSDCNIISNMDYTPFVEYHIQKGADITMMYKTVNVSEEEAAVSTLVKLDSTGRVCDVMIDPKTEGMNQLCLDVYVVEKDLLVDLIREAAAKGEVSFDRSVLQGKKDSLKIYGYGYDGFVEDIYTMQSYYRANMDLLNPEARKVLFPVDRPVYTKIRDEVPVKYGIDAVTKNSLIADGCIIEGNVENCILFRGVIVKPGARVKNSIIMQGSVIGSKCEVSHVIADKNVVFNDYRVVTGTIDYPVYLAKGSRV